MRQEMLERILKQINDGITEIRLHGRGGQGAVLASKILSKAFYNDGICPQTFPKYGVERRGAPAAAFVRLSANTSLIQIRCEIYRPHHLIVLDSTLINQINIVEGLRESGWIVINSADAPARFASLGPFRIATVDATGIALAHRLGSKTSPVTNSAILGAFSKVYGSPRLESLLESIKENVPVKPEENAAAAADSFHQCRTDSR